MSTLGTHGLGIAVSWRPAAGARTLQAAASPPVADADWPPTDPAFPALMLTSLNRFRAQNGVAALVLDARLLASSAYKARHMAQYLYMDHNDPDTLGHPAETFAQRVSAFYGVFAISENIAYGDYSADAAHTTIYDADGYLVAVDKAALAEGLVQAFGSDIGHRANELNTGSVGVGFAVAWSKPAGSTVQLPFCVQDYGWDTHVVPPGPAPDPGPTPPPVVPPIAVGSRWRNKTTGKIVTVTKVTPVPPAAPLRVTYHGPAHNAKSVTKDVAVFRTLFEGPVA